MVLNAEPVDPRDIGWEVDQPVYRVYFWGRQSPQREVREADMGYAAVEYRLTGAADVLEVLEWARRTAGPEQIFVVYVEQADDDGPGLIKLLGDDPTEPD